MNYIDFLITIGIMCITVPVGAMIGIRLERWLHEKGL